ncbi:MIP/aquaporin family protein [Sporolactobacillus laevolacticus]|uniref:MIP/aquaporin family protein n=1 Tax=Sporolactobacillus laevolacticus TaxID=33018 RepID=UPI0025B61BCA|nr:MIP/aquaporin family protein [Sporolactobacillus laevolacticus]MDN3955047.1 MIP/aquaporin family protein [Sporolactobacillus laevolacticus]
MVYGLTVRWLSELLGTAIMIMLGNGAVANVELKGTKGYQNGWMLIAVGYGFGVMIPVMMFGPISGSQINPAITLALAVNGLQQWSNVVPYITAQFLGAMLGQLLLFLAYKPFYDQTDNPSRILGTCSTISASGSFVNGFINEFIGTFILVFSALLILNSHALIHTPGVAELGVGFLVWALVASLGGPTGPGLNPARDLGPRIVHALIPLKNKGTSQWTYAWIPVVAPILAGIAAVFLYKMIYFGQ